MPSPTVIASDPGKKAAEAGLGLSGQQLLDLITRLTSKDSDGEKPRTKEAETIKLNDMPAPEAYRHWRNHVRDEVKSCSDKPDEAWLWLNEVFDNKTPREKLEEKLQEPGKFITLDTKSKTMSHYDYSYIHSSTGWCPQTWCERWFRFTPWILVPSITLEFSRSHISSERYRTGSPSTLKPPFTSGIFQLPQVWAFELPANAAWRRLIKNVTPKKQRLEIWEWLGNDKGMIRE